MNTTKPVADREKEDFEKWYLSQTIVWQVYHSRDDMFRIWQAALSTQGQPVGDIALSNIRELWGALRLIREAIEQVAPPGSVPNDVYLEPSPGHEAEAIVKGIAALASQQPVAATGDDEWEAFSDYARSRGHYISHIVADYRAAQRTAKGDSCE